MAIERLGELSKVEKRTAMALAMERARILGELQEYDEAIHANIVAVAERMKLPPQEYLLEQVDASRIMLVRVVPEPAADPGQGEPAEGGDG